MLDHLARLPFRAGAQIFKEGDVDNCAYIIESGIVGIYVLEKGVERQIGVISKGELLGEIALIDHMPRTATAKAIEDTVLIPIQSKMMDELLDKSDPIVRYVMYVILERFRSSRSPNKYLAATLAARAGIKKHKDDIRGEATQNLTLSHDIAHALSHNEFVMHYQPICELSSGRVAGFEALIRWHHPRDGLMPPMDFLWLAEQTGQIREIGLWTLERACKDWPALKQRTDFETPFISINMSPSQLTGDGFVEDVKSTIHRLRIPPAELKLELLETVIINYPEVAYRSLNQITELGSSIALDDYGTGHSGLESLKRYPISTMKIDRNFVFHMLTSAQDMEIVSSSIKLAHSLGMDVVAEGIETEEVRRELLDRGCNFGQGWLFGRPAALKDIA